MLSVTQRRLRSQIAGNTRWAKETDRTAATTAMRDGFHAKLRAQAKELLGAGATGEDVEQAYRNLLSAHYAKMRLNSLKARQRKSAPQLRDEDDPSSQGR